MARIITYSLNPALDLAIGLDALRPGEVVRSHSTRLDAAGKGINVATVLRGLGHELRVAGFLGEDNQGPFLRAFSSIGLSDEFVRVPGETRINAKISEAGGRVTDINGPGAMIDERAWRCLLDKIPAQVDGVDAIVVSGSLPPGISVDQFGVFLDLLARNRCPLWLDTSGKGLAGVQSGRISLIKPNEHELAELVGHPLVDTTARTAAARNLVASGFVGDVLLSLGEHGAFWASVHGAIGMLPPKVEVMSTVGAGDTLLAGALHGSLVGWTRERSLRYAMALAADCVRHVGTGRPDARDLDELCTQVEPVALPSFSPEPVKSAEIPQ